MSFKVRGVIAEDARRASSPVNLDRLCRDMQGHVLRVCLHAQLSWRIASLSDCLEWSGTDAKICVKPMRRCCRSGDAILRGAGRQNATRTEGRRSCSGVQIAVFRRHGPEERQPERLPRQKKCGTGVLRVCLHRWLNRANEKLPAEPEKAGSSRHPGPGCEHG